MNSVKKGVFRERKVGQMASSRRRKYQVIIPVVAIFLIIPLVAESALATNGALSR